MSKRRSMDDALTPEEQAFLDEGHSHGAKREPKPSKPKEEPPMARHALKHEFEHEIALPLANPPSAPMTGVVSLNVRIEPAISIALLRASMERKIRRMPQFTQRDIVSEALADWLRRNGYLS